MHEVGWLDSRHFDAHVQESGHPEKPERLYAIRDAFAKRNLDRLLRQKAPTPVSLELLSQIHTPDYIYKVETLCQKGGGKLDHDTGVCAKSWRASLLAAGAVVDAVGSVLQGKWERAFCSVRPPGHHALPERGMGFCVFANVALGAQAAINSGRVQRVAIVDWDVHHGNGTQQIFWHRNDVFYASIHQHPLFPGTGAAQEVGEGPGKGATLNCPLPPGSGDAQLLAAWNEQIEPALERFGPELILVSAGFDAEARDPLAQLEVTPRGFARLSAKVVRFAETHCRGRVVSVLEGGYSLLALAECVPWHVETLL